jgi:hypothetical protein
MCRSAPRPFDKAKLYIDAVEGDEVDVRELE